MKKKHILLVTIAVVAITFLTIFYWPTSVLRAEDVPSARIGALLIQGGEYYMVQISEFDEPALIEYLTTCQMRRTILQPSNYGSTGGYHLSFLLMKPNETTSITLGNQNFTSENTQYYRILNDKQVFDDIMSILKLEIDV